MIMAPTKHDQRVVVCKTLRCPVRGGCFGTSDVTWHKLELCRIAEEQLGMMYDFHALWRSSLTKLKHVIETVSIIELPMCCLPASFVVGNVDIAA